MGPVPGGAEDEEARVGLWTWGLQRGPGHLIGTVIRATPPGRCSKAQHRTGSCGKVRLGPRVPALCPRLCGQNRGALRAGVRTSKGSQQWARGRPRVKTEEWFGPPTKAVGRELRPLRGGRGGPP